MHKLQRGAKTFLRSFLPSAYASRKRYFLRQVIYLGSVVFIALLAVNLLFMSKRNSKQPVVAGNEAKTSVQEQPQIKTTATVEPQNRPALKKQPAITAADGLPIAPANTADWKKSPLDGSWHICYDEAIKEASANNKPLFIVFAADEKPEKGNSFYNKYFNSIFTVMSPNFEREEAVWLYVGSKQDTDAPEVQQQYNSQLKQHFINDMRMMPQNRGVLLSLYPDGKQISEPLLMAIDIAKLRAKLRSDYRSFKNNYNK